MPGFHATPPADPPGRDPADLKLLPTSAGVLPEGLTAGVDRHLPRFAEHLIDA